MHCARPLRLLAYLTGLLPTLAGAAGTYQYDELDNLQVLTTNTGIHTYTYDEINRLDQESGPTGARDHAYDANGNRSTDGAGTTATYSPNSDRLATVNGTTMNLDAAGNILSDGINTYTWDAAGRLKTVSRANKLWATYYYDYKSRRTRKETTTRAPQGAQVVVYHYDLEDQLLAETLADGTPLKTYVWDDGRLVALLDHATTPPTLLTFDTDHLGTPRAARTGAGSVVWRWDSDGYGTTPPNEDPDGDGKKIVINLRFPGQYYDQESGLHYNWYRYYSPRLGRYLSADPIGVASGPNTYTYVRGNPMSLIDPFGLVDLNLFPGSEPISKYADLTVSPDGTYTIGGHGNPSLIVDANGNVLTPEELARRILQDPRYKNSDNVQLLSCNTGSGPDSFAQRLADILGKTVVGPDNYVWYYPDGRTIVAPGKYGGLDSPDLTGPGSWITYPPR